MSDEAFRARTDASAKAFNERCPDRSASDHDRRPDGDPGHAHGREKEKVVGGHRHTAGEDELERPVLRHAERPKAFAVREKRKKEAGRKEKTQGRHPEGREFARIQKGLGGARRPPQDGGARHAEGAGEKTGTHEKGKGEIRGNLEFIFSRR